MEQVLEVIRLVAFILLTVGFNVFVVQWGIKKPWQIESARYLWFVIVMLTFVLDLVLVFRFARIPEGVEDWLGVVIWTVFAVLIWRLVIAVVMARRRE